MTFFSQIPPYHMRHGQVTWQEYGMVNDGNAKKMGLSPVILLTAIPKYGYISQLLIMAKMLNIVKICQFHFKMVKWIHCYVEILKGHLHVDFQNHPDNQFKQGIRAWLGLRWCETISLNGLDTVGSFLMEVSSTPSWLDFNLHSLFILLRDWE